KPCTHRVRGARRRQARSRRAHADHALEPPTREYAARPIAACKYLLTARLRRVPPGGVDQRPDSGKSDRPREAWRSAWRHGTILITDGWARGLAGDADGWGVY